MEGGDGKRKQDAVVIREGGFVDGGDGEVHVYGVVWVVHGEVVNG